MSPQAKGILFITIYIFLGFIWGYKRGLDAKRMELGISEQARAINKAKELIEGE